MTRTWKNLVQKKYTGNLVKHIKNISTTFFNFQSLVLYLNKAKKHILKRSGRYSENLEEISQKLVLNLHHTQLSLASKELNFIK